MILTPEKNPFCFMFLIIKFVEVIQKIYKGSNPQITLCFGGLNPQITLCLAAT